MNQYSKQFALVNKIKAIVRLTGRAIRGKSRHNEITEDIARKIQRSAYELNSSEKKEEFTPPYKQLAKQLQVHDVHIYSATVYNLVKIAQNNPEYHSDILKILQMQLKDTEVPVELREYISNKLTKL